jgi:porin
MATAHLGTENLLSPAADEQALLTPLEKWLPTLLSVIAGSVDLTGFLALGIFTAHITGNVVVIGALVVRHSRVSPASILAIPVFILAVAATWLLAKASGKRGRSLMRLLLAVQFFLLVGLLVLSVATKPSRDPHGLMATIAAMLAVFTMACQYALLRLTLPVAPSTAVMTGNLTNATLALMDANLGTQPLLAGDTQREKRSLHLLLGFFVGCVAAAAAVTYLGDWAWALPVVLAGLAAAWPAAPLSVGTARSRAALSLFLCALILALAACGQAKNKHAKVELKASLAGADSPQHRLKTQGHFFGDWNGERERLLEKGYAFDLDYSNDSLWNVGGSKRERVNVWERMRATVDIDLSRHLPDPGLTFHATAVWQNGSNPGTYLGSITNPAGTASEPTSRLDSWWFQQELQGTPLIFRIGQFAALDNYGAQIFGHSYVFEPLQYAPDNLGTVFESFDPPSTSAAEIRVVPTSHLYVKAMVFAADRNPYAHNPTGFVPTFKGAAAVASEVGYVFGKSARDVHIEDSVESRVGYWGVYQFGSVYNPGRFVAAGQPRLASGDYILYGLASQALYRTAKDTDRGLDGTFAITSTPADRAHVSQVITTGLRVNEPYPIPFHNIIALAYVHNGISSQMPLLPPAQAPFLTEHAVEVNTLIDFPRGILVQPVAQYILHSSGTRQSAWLTGFHVKIDF